MSALDTIARIVSPDDIRATLRSTPAYEINRDRAAVVVHDGLAAYDTYVQLQPYLFWGSLLGLAASAWAFEKKGRRPDNREAMLMYGGAFALCAATAWFTRPRGAPVIADNAPRTAPEEAAPEQEGALIGWLDNRAQELKAEDPAFADRALQRLVNMPGVRTQFQKMNPLLQAAVV